MVLFLVIINLLVFINFLLDLNVLLFLSLYMGSIFRIFLVVNFNLLFVVEEDYEVNFEDYGFLVEFVEVVVIKEEDVVDDILFVFELLDVFLFFLFLKLLVNVEYVDVDLGLFKLVFRNYVKIEYRVELGRFCLEILGRNGVWIDDRFYVKGVVVFFV